MAIRVLQEIIKSELELHSKQPSAQMDPLWSGLRVRAGIASGVEASDVVLNKQRCAAAAVFSLC